MDKLSSFSILAFLISFILGITCIFYIGRILVSQKVIIKVMEDSLGSHATDKSIIAMVCVVLGLLSACFFAVCAGIYFSTFFA